MGIKKVSFYKVSSGPLPEIDIKPVPITFDPMLENWAFSVALTYIAMPPSPWVYPEVSLATVSAGVVGDRRAADTVMYGTSEEYGRLRSLELVAVAQFGIEVGGLLTLYEYETAFDRIGELEKPTDRGMFGV